MNIRKLSGTGIGVAHTVGLLVGATAICITACALAPKKPQTIADKAKKAFRSIEDTLSV